jgi:membrane protease YdiL (CAAX protease family)
VLSVVLFFALGGSVADLQEPPSFLEGFRGYLVLNAGFLSFLAGIVLVVVAIHRRGLRTLVTPRSSIDTKRIALGFSVWFALLCVSALVYFLLAPSSFSFGPEPAALVVPFALVALILTPLQTTTEELFFRGYLVQGASLISKSPIFLVTVSAVLFGLLHLLNPEVDAGFVPMALYYLAFGVFLAWISLKDGTTELAIGAHTANNLVAAIVLSFPGSTFKTPSIFYIDWFAPWLDLVGFLTMSALFYLLVFVVLKQRHNLGGHPEEV